MENKPKRYWGIIFLGLLIIGCASRKEIVQFKQDMVYLKVQTNALRNDNEEIKKELTAINKSVAGLQEENRRIKADILSELTNLKNQTQFLDSKLDDTSYRMTKLLHTVEDNTVKHPAPDSSFGASNQQFSARENATVDVNPRELYNTAYLDLSSGNYQLALQGFQEYLYNFPDGEFADNAQYWIGETYYARGDYKTASDEFRKVIINYPRGKKLAAALLKMGYCAIQLGDLTNARKHFSSVIQLFPKSEEAALAKARLEEMQ